MNLTITLSNNLTFGESTMFNKTIYLLQPSYRKMDGSMLKELPTFNYAINMPMLSACIPADWLKRFTIEYFDAADLNPSEEIIIITSPGYDIAHAVELARHYKSLGKTVIFGSHTDELSDQLMRSVCDTVYYGYPNPNSIKLLLNDIENKNLNHEYRWGYDLDYTFDYSVFDGCRLTVVPVMASAGCKNNCSYCCYPPVFKNHYKVRNVEYVIEDLKQVAKFKKPVAFLDGNLFNNRKYLISLCNAISKEKLNIRWGGQSTVDIGDDTEVLKVLRDAGCELLLLGLETLEKENEAQLRKQIFPVDRFEQQIKRIHKSGLKVGAYFILGLDNDTPATFDKVAGFIDRTGIALPYLHVLVPIPGTAIYSQLKAENRLLADDFEDYLIRNPEFSVPCSVPYFLPSKMTGDDVERLFLILNKFVYNFASIFKRSLSYNLFIMIALLKLNLEARRKYLAMKRSYQKRAKK